jgi:hypothetical protein
MGEFQMPRPRAEHKPHRIGLAWRVELRNSAVKRRTVDDSLVLSIKELFDQDIIEENALRAGSLSWRNVETFQFHGTIWYEARDGWAGDGLWRCPCLYGASLWGPAVVFPMPGAAHSCNEAFSSTRC